MSECSVKDDPIATTLFTAENMLSPQAFIHNFGFSPIKKVGDSSFGSGKENVNFTKLV
jgi:hypothetical protein